jgi:probable lipoprotein NlpC
MKGGMRVHLRIAKAIMSQCCARLHLSWLSLSLAIILLAGCAGQPAYQSSGSTSYPGPSGSRHASDHSAVSEALRDYFQKWRGVPYRYGGVNRSGIDCSSFVRQTMSDLQSLELPRTTAAQALAGQPVPPGNLSPGDLVFFKTGFRSRHVGIYVGDGRFMHASTSRGVTMSRMDNVYWQRHYWQSRRVNARTN